MLRVPLAALHGDVPASVYGVRRYERMVLVGTSKQRGAREHYRRSGGGARTQVGMVIRWSVERGGVG